MSSRRTLSRRDMLRRFLPRQNEATEVIQDSSSQQVAIIQGRHCLAYQKSFCSVCSERCPEPGAIVTEQGIPRIITDKCTGCKICHDVCPAPTNAILITTPKKPIITN